MSEHHWAVFEAITRRRTDRGTSETLLDAVAQADKASECGTYWIVYTDDLAIVAQGRRQDRREGCCSGEEGVEEDHDVCACCWQGPPWPLLTTPEMSVQ